MPQRRILPTSPTAYAARRAPTVPAQRTKQLGGAGCLGTKLRRASEEHAVYGTRREGHTCVATMAAGCKLSRHTGHTPAASAGAIGVTSPGSGDKEGTVSGLPGAGERGAERRGEAARERCDIMRATAGSVRGGAVCFSRPTRESSDCRHTGLPKCWRPG